MGIDVVQWRSSIGLFNPTNSKKRISAKQNVKHFEMRYSGIIVFTKLLHVLMPRLTITCSISVTVLALLVVSGVELNPGPYSVSKNDTGVDVLSIAARAEHHQGSGKYMELSRGKQCMANCMTFILYAFQ